MSSLLPLILTRSRQIGTVIPSVQAGKVRPGLAMVLSRMGVGGGAGVGRQPLTVARGEEGTEGPGTERGSQCRFGGAGGR